MLSRAADGLGRKMSPGSAPVDVTSTIDRWLDWRPLGCLTMVLLERDNARSLADAATLHPLNRVPLFCSAVQVHVYIVLCLFFPHAVHLSTCFPPPSAHRLDMVH